MRPFNQSILLVLTLFLPFLGGNKCGQSGIPGQTETSSTAGQPTEEKSPLEATGPIRQEPFARATMEPKSGSHVEGTVEFYDENGGLFGKVRLKNVPVGGHGFFILEQGACSDKAGPHLNPTDNPHGASTDPNAHLGDLGNLLAQEDGMINHEGYYRPPHSTTPEITHSIIGKAVILTAKPDDYQTQPDGDTGEAIACGVITRAD